MNSAFVLAFLGFNYHPNFVEDVYWSLGASATVDLSLSLDGSINWKLTLLLLVCWALDVEEDQFWSYFRLPTSFYDAFIIYF